MPRSAWAAAHAHIPARTHAGIDLLFHKIDAKYRKIGDESSAFRELSLHQFLEALIRVAAEKYSGKMDVPNGVEFLLNQHVLKYSGGGSDQEAVIVASLASPADVTSKIGVEHPACGR